MKETPILMCGEMVRPTLADLKTNTRRIVKLPVIDRNGTGCELAGCELNGMLREGRFDICPFGGPGDVLWVKEQHFRWGKFHRGKWCFRDDAVGLERDGGLIVASKRTEEGWHRRPSIFMPRWASRLTLEITDIKVERVQDITEDDAKAEGVEGRWHPKDPQLWTWRDYGYPDSFRYGSMWHARESYRTLWDSLNKKRGFGWETNCWVWSIHFRRLK